MPIDPATGEVLCMVTNSPTGPNDALAIATAYPPGSAIKPAQALVFLSEGIVKPDTKIACHDGFEMETLRLNAIRIILQKHLQVHWLYLVTLGS